METEPTQDYVEEEDTEEVVLTRWERLKKWFEIVMATKKLAMFVWTLVFGVGGTMAVGKITDTNPLRDTAIELGIVEADPIDTTSGMLREELMTQLTTMQQKILDIEAQVHEHPYATSKHTHPDPEPLQRAAISAMIAEELDGIVPQKHMELH